MSEVVQDNANVITFCLRRLITLFVWLITFCSTEGHLSTKCDVYGFGVVLLEMLTGRRAYDQRRPENEYHLVDWAKPYLTSKRKSLHVMDPHIKGQYIDKAASSAISLALECVSSDPKLRPDANYVVKALEQLQDLKN